MKLGIAVLLEAAVLTGVATAQRATEVYTPIGKSPGLSGKYTVIGSVRDVDPESGTCVVVDSDRAWEVEVTERTRIWLDKSSIRQSNETGSFDDLRPEARVEVLFEDRDGRQGGPARWIKIEVSETR